jgi:glycine dehydrogenase
MLRRYLWSPPLIDDLTAPSSAGPLGSAAGSAESVGSAETDRSIGLDSSESFLRRHVGTSPDEQQQMLKELGYASLNDLVDVAVPEGVRSLADLDLPPAATESEVLAELQALAGQNVVAEPMIGLGYYPTVTPGVIRRNILESPAWYTAYTPYQPEISQGRLEALLNFQTMVADLTGLPIANA